MLKKLRLFLLFVIALTSLSRLGEAANTPALSDSMRFFGRWDLRTPDRAITVDSGSYVLAHFSGSSVEALFDVSNNQAPFPTIAWRIDESKDWQEAEVAPTVKLADGLSNGPHTLWLMVRGFESHRLNRWIPPLVASVTFIGLDLASNGNMLPALEAWDHPKLKIEFLGDSITEGVLIQPKRPGKKTKAWEADAPNSYSSLTAQLLGAMWRQVGFGSTGLVRSGSGGAPGALESFNFFYAGCPRDDWQPDLVVINQGTNEESMPPAQYLPLYTQYLTLVRKAYPKAKIAALRPFDGAQADSIKQAVDAARTAGDTSIVYIDTTGWYDGPASPQHPLHPNAAASGPIADHLSAALKENHLAP